jgi:hypothetical protein
VQAKPSAEETLKRFWLGLSKQALARGWLVGREMDGRSNRGFVLERDGRQLHFFVKVSQADRGFWGLHPEKATEIVQGGREALILLTGAYDGYLITATRLRRLLPSFSRAAGQADHKINEGKVEKEPRFTTLIRLWEYLEPLADRAAAG